MCPDLYAYCRYGDEDLDARAEELAGLVAPRILRALVQDRAREEQGFLVANDRLHDHEEYALPLPDHYHARRGLEAAGLVRVVHDAIHSRLRHEVQHLRTAKVNLLPRSKRYVCW